MRACQWPPNTIVLAKYSLLLKYWLSNSTSSCLGYSTGSQLLAHFVSSLPHPWQWCFIFFYRWTQAFLSPSKLLKSNCFLHETKLSVHSALSSASSHFWCVHQTPAALAGSVPSAEHPQGHHAPASAGKGQRCVYSWHSWEVAELGSYEVWLL